MREKVKSVNKKNKTIKQIRNEKITQNYVINGLIAIVICIKL